MTGFMISATHTNRSASWYLPLVACASAVFTLLLTWCATAQEVTILPQRMNNAVRADVGVDSAIVVRAEYLRRLKLTPVKDLLFSGRVTAGLTAFDLLDSVVELSARGTALRAGNWRVDVRGGPFLRNSDNALFAAHEIGIGLSLLPGYESARWGLLLDIGYEQALTTKLSHSRAYRDRIYADAKDGWYRDLSANLRAGVITGMRVGPTEITLRGGMLTPHTLQPLTVPYYAMLGAGYRF